MAEFICYIVTMIPAASRKVPLHVPKHLFSCFAAIMFAVFLGPAQGAAPAAADDSPPFDGSAHYLIKQGEYVQALEMLNNAFRLSPGDESARKELIAAYAEIGKREFRSNRFHEAAVYFREAYQLSPDKQELGILLGIALYGGKQYAEAARELERSRHNGGDNLPLLFYLGRVYLESGDPAKALSAWERALAMEPDIPPLRAMADRVRRGLATN